ncbi:unnamed protein product [Paramecium sonneborni]|uniref:Uncharacterized protein n=1 Tax=Paramecium sonneborni TaxID=65129 RepID=A0A8S1RAM8_9CILI|nr:unnamed protein product [Paramecium sonneborni]
MNRDEINLVDIQQAGFSAENLLSIILSRDKLVNGLMNWLHQGSKNKWLDDKQNQLYIRVLKVCAVHYGYYQLKQGFNFIASENDYVKMTNQFYKIFETENEYKEQIQQFKNQHTRQIKILREDLEKRMNILLKWKEKFKEDWEKIQIDFNENLPHYNKFYKLKQQIEQPNQVDFDIYQYYFGLFYSEEWFKQPIEQNSIELLRLHSFIKQFLRLDTVYPIEFYANQSAALLEINENEKQKEYYLKIIKQR